MNFNKVLKNPTMVNITIKCMYSLMGDVDDVLSDDQFMYCYFFF